MSAHETIPRATVAGMNAHDRRLSPRLERVAGAARLSCVRRGAATGIGTLYQRAPCRFLFPNAAAGDPFTAVLLTTSGGLTGGDKLDIDIDIAEAAAAVVTTQAAEKIYRSTGPECSVRVRISVAPEAWGEWLMQETILFDGARLSRRTEANVAASGRLLAVESLVFGRKAMGEDFARGSVHDVWRVRRGDRLVWIDALKLDGAVMRREAFGLGEAAGAATLLYVGEDATRHLDVARAALAETEAQGGATSFDGVLILRLLAADAMVLRAGVAHIIVRLRAAIAGLPAHMPRVWSM